MANDTIKFYVYGEGATEYKYFDFLKTKIADKNTTPSITIDLDVENLFNSNRSKTIKACEEKCHNFNSANTEENEVTKYFYMFDVDGLKNNSKEEEKNKLCDLITTKKAFNVFACASCHDFEVFLDLHDIPNPHNLVKGDKANLVVKTYFNKINNKTVNELITKIDEFNKKETSLYTYVDKFFIELKKYIGDYPDYKYNNILRRSST